MQAMRFVITYAVTITPDALVMRAMGWTNSAHLVLLGAWALIATALIVLIPERHRRPELSPRIVVVALIGWVLLGMLVLATKWEVRVVLATLLIQPGITYLLLEAAGLTPEPVTQNARPQ